MEESAPSEQDIYPKCIVCGFSENNKHFGHNNIRTTRYTWLNCLPLYLWDVFNPKYKLANIFFLLVSILQCIPSISLTNGLPSSLPSLLTIIGAEAVHMCILEHKRRKSDREINSRTASVWSTSRNAWVECQWKDILVGDLVKIRKGEEIPCDMVILRTNEDAEKSQCFITTTNIDGETDIKTKVALQLTSQRSISSFLEERPLIRCEAENPFTSTFDGVLHFPNSSSLERISIDSLVLRSCRLVFTEWIVGCVVSVGSRTKIEFSTRTKPPKKESDTLALLNRMIVYLLFLLLFVCVISAALSVLWDRKPVANLSISMTSPLLHFIKNFFVYFQLCYQIVPASLYVCVEIALLLQTFFMECDLDCADTPTDHIHVRNAGIIDELGHVTHVLSDKTGTMTANNLRVASIATRQTVYSLPHPSGLPSSSSSLLVGDPSLRALLLNMVTNHSALSIHPTDRTELDEFAESISFAQSQSVSSCSRSRSRSRSRSHSFSFSEIRVGSQSELTMSSLVSTGKEEDEEEKEGDVQVFCSSQDERAVLDAVALFHCRFVSRSQTDSSMRITLDGSPRRIDVLLWLPFTTERKRTTIVLEVDQTVWLFTKGADSAVFPLTWPGDMSMEHVHRYVEQCSKQAYRTLVFAGKQLDKGEFEDWLNSLAMSGYTPSTAPEPMQRQLEANVHLQGAIAIQDDLAEDAVITIKRLQAAGIRVWMLTGDKAVTAEAIAQSAGLIDSGQPILRLTAADCEHLSPSLLVETLREYNQQDDHTPILVDEYLVDIAFSSQSSSTASLAIPSNREQAIVSSPLDPTELSTTSLSLHEEVLHSLYSAQSVIIARMRKDQKQIIARQLKAYGRRNAKPVHVLSVGDGANDIGMIREGNIGVGIKGKEGLQAFNNCDVGLPSFRCLNKLVLVHGRSNENRLQTLILYFLYKNTLLSIVTLLLSYMTVFSGLKVMPSWGIDFYNTYFTSVPILTIASIDFFCDKELLRRIPQLYSRQWHAPQLTTRNFFVNLVSSVLDGIGILVLCLLCYGIDSYADCSASMTISTSYLGVVVFTLLVLIANVKILFISSLHYAMLFLFIVLSVVLWLVTLAVISGFVSFPAESFDLYGSFMGMVSNIHTLLVVVFVISLLSLFSLVRLSLTTLLFPSTSQIINEIYAGQYRQIMKYKPIRNRVNVHQSVAKHVNLTVQSLLKQEYLMMNQLDSLEYNHQFTSDRPDPSSSV